MQSDKAAHETSYPPNSNITEPDRHIENKSILARPVAVELTCLASACYKEVSDLTLWLANPPVKQYTCIFFSLWLSLKLKLIRTSPPGLLLPLPAGKIGN